MMVSTVHVRDGPRLGTPHPTVSSSEGPQDTSSHDGGTMGQCGGQESSHIPQVWLSVLTSQWSEVRSLIERPLMLGCSAQNYLEAAGCSQPQHEAWLAVQNMSPPQ